MASEATAGADQEAADGRGALADSTADGWDATGPIGAPAIVFVHGSRLTRAAWLPQAELLAGSFRCVVVDLPGHGALGDRSFTLDAAVDHVAAAIDAAGGRAVVVGLSLGGYVAMALGARSPERVAGLVLSGATREPVDRWAAPFRALAWLLRSVPEAAIAAMERQFFRSRYPRAIAEPIVAAGSWPRGGSDSLRAIAGQRFLPRLAAYEGPTLVINGSFDLVFRSGERAFLEAARHADRRILRGATHLANLDRPDAFAEAVAAFVQRAYGIGR